MKKKYNIIVIIGLLLINYTALAQESTVLLDKSFPVNKSASLELNNQFGNITVTTWNKPEFYVKAQLVLTGLSEKEAQKIKEKVNVSSSQNSDRVSVETLFKKGGINMNGSGKKFEINYTVKVPDNHKLDIKNSFGNFSIQDYNGPVELNVEYGNISLGNLKTLKLKLAFGNGNIQSIKEGKLDVEYADQFNINSVIKLDLDNSFSKVTIESAELIKLDSKYGTLKIGTVDILEGDSEFSGMKIKRLNKRLELDGSYVSGSMEIESIATDFELIDLEIEFSSVELNFEPGVKIPFEVSTSFGDFKYPNSKVNLTSRIEKDFGKEFKGTLGEGNTSSGKVTVETSYGNATFKVN
ncbi:hypothetical protein C9994_05060 [Marivirga lumbricoides]|uniref:Adhesin domain-containing protein n=1 Tax=Marivirga lumbricoides TaxID=1046115 RepID=A0A2T4DTA9_9BACT|nr:hypothetical protein C9994_05060 [Marivirga lumbricoides]